MAQINLAPGTQYLTMVRRRRRVLYGITAALIVITALTWGGVALVERSTAQQLTESQQQLRSLETEIAAAQNDVRRIELFENRLRIMDELLQKRVTWSPILQEIERLLPGPTVLTEIHGVAEDNHVVVAGRTPTVDEIAQTFASLTSAPDRQTIFTDAEVNTIGREQAPAPEGETGPVIYNFEALLEIRPPSNDTATPL